MGKIMWTSVAVWTALCLMGVLIAAWLISPLTAVLTGTSTRTQFRIIFCAYTVALFAGVLAAAIQRLRNR
jgi:hypothetical protein